ncbi:hypothetical protein FA95DRAFT_885093 [Auriscalpium vulgare]|uniref:Uncharacterized protein n=1 Tax=Auriscalpium vulgare TaxID=40419 RepID=A0ACB8R879_9AGAM|nr:hypothetical protein FA95DRAFT_885093 [Auriscalpium vulgare]
MHRRLARPRSITAPAPRPLPNAYPRTLTPPPDPRLGCPRSRRPPGPSLAAPNQPSSGHRARACRAVRRPRPRALQCRPSSRARRRRCGPRRPRSLERSSSRCEMLRYTTSALPPLVPSSAPSPPTRAHNTSISIQISIHRTAAVSRGWSQPVPAGVSPWLLRLGWLLRLVSPTSMASAHSARAIGLSGPCLRGYMPVLWPACACATHHPSTHDNCPSLLRRMQVPPSYIQPIICPRARRCFPCARGHLSFLLDTYNSPATRLASSLPSIPLNDTDAPAPLTRAPRTI